MSKFYSYLWMTKNGLPYYAGQGTGRRAFTRRTNRTVTRPSEKNLIVIFPMATQELALESEKALIALFGRKDNETGILENQTDGGEGKAGHKWSTNTREKMKRRIPWNKGKTYKLPASWAAAVAEATARRWKDPEFKNKVASQISAALTGKKLSAEHRAAIGKCRKGKPWTEARRKAQKKEYVAQN